MKNKNPNGLTFMNSKEYKEFLNTYIEIPKQINIRYTEFRAEIYKIVDKALAMSTNPIVDSIHIELEDDIDDLLTWLIRKDMKDRHDTI